MKIKIDADLCTGHGRCSIVAPDFYKLDDNGYSADRGKTLDVPDGLESAARHGAKKCPERAIAVIED
jgi:ferredoxin